MKPLPGVGQVLVVRVWMLALIALALLLRLTGWVLPLDVRLWGMCVVGFGLGWTVARAKRIGAL